MKAISHEIIFRHEYIILQILLEDRIANYIENLFFSLTDYHYIPIMSINSHSLAINYALENELITFENMRYILTKKSLIELL